MMKHPSLIKQERVFIETDKNKYMIKIWDNLERLEFYWYYKDDDENFSPIAMS